MITMIKEINNKLHEQQLMEQKILNRLYENITYVFPEQQLQTVVENVIDFLHKTAQMIKNGEKLSPEQAHVVASKLTSLELVADPGTRGAALSVISGNDPMKKISTIMKQTSDEAQISNPVDKVLVALSNKVGKSGVKRNTELFSNLEGLNDKQRNEKATELMNIAKQFEKLDVEIQKAQQKQQVPSAQPAV